MTDQEINIAVAELCGADEILESTGGFAASAYWPESWRAKLERLSQTVSRSDERPGKIVSAVPKFSSDLNACHEMEKTLSNEMVTAYDTELNNVVFLGARVCDWSVYPADKIWHATAHQRCEAFLKVHNRWKD